MLASLRKMPQILCHLQELGVIENGALRQKLSFLRTSVRLLAVRVFLYVSGVKKLA